MSYNLYKRFIQLFPGEPLRVGVVTAVETGRVTVELPDGGFLNVHGEASVGQNVFVRGGAIEGLAPNLSVVSIEI